MDFEWVDIGKGPDLLAAIRSAACSAMFAGAEFPGRGSGPGIYVALNVAGGLID